MPLSAGRQKHHPRTGCVDRTLDVGNPIHFPGVADSNRQPQLFLRNFDNAVQQRGTAGQYNSPLLKRDMIFTVIM